MVTSVCGASCTSVGFQHLVLSSDPDPCRVEVGTLRGSDQECEDMREVLLLSSTDVVETTSGHNLKSDAGKHQTLRNDLFPIQDVSLSVPLFADCLTDCVSSCCSSKQSSSPTLTLWGLTHSSALIALMLTVSIRFRRFRLLCDHSAGSLTGQ